LRVAANRRPRPTLLVFHRRTCGVSRKVQARLAAVLQAGGNHKTFRIAAVSADDEPVLVTRFHVTTVPEIVVVEDRGVRAMLRGASRQHEIRAALAAWLK
jgi:thioredoxin-like negative regulator of GroEL